MSEPTTRELIARSSLGGAAWCAVCDHPRDSHRGLRACGFPVRWGGSKAEFCPCTGFIAMSPERWLRTHGRNEPAHD